jgi:hypothetical protein
MMDLDAGQRCGHVMVILIHRRADVATIQRRARITGFGSTGR